MALAHNGIIRGLNSIYLQAPHVKPEDKPDFVGYALTWFGFALLTPVLLAYWVFRQLRPAKA